MKKSIIAASSFASISLIASAALAAPLPSTGNVTLMFDAKQSVDVSCQLDTTYKIDPSGVVIIEANGLNASGDYPCGLLSFKQDIKVDMDTSGSGSSVASLYNIRLDTVYGECNQVTPIVATRVSEWVVSGSGNIEGVVYPSTNAPCWFNGYIVFS